MPTLILAKSAILCCTLPSCAAKAALFSTHWGNMCPDGYLPARCALINSNVVPAMFTLIPTPPLFPTLPPMSPVVTASFEVPAHEFTFSSYATV